MSGVRGIVLASAYEYHPQGVSEAWTAHRLVSSLRSQGWRMVVATRWTPNKPRWYGVARIACRMPKKPLLWAPNYAEFSMRTLPVARRFSQRIALLHHMTPISLRVPSALPLFDAPFIWGPVGGSVPFPPGFSEYGSSSGPAGLLRRLDGMRLRWDPTLRFTMKRADRIVTTTTSAAAMIPEVHRDRVVVIPEAIDDAMILDQAPVEQDYIFSSGRMLPYKALDLVLRAFARLRGDGSIRLVMTGDGQMLGAMGRLVAELGLEKRVDLRGRVDKAENQRLMQGAVLCAFPALREAFGHVNLEAMAAWKPVVVTDWGGPRDLVVDGVTGFRVLGTDPADHVARLAAAMQRIVDDADLRRRMGAAGAARVKAEYAWSSVGRRYDRLYRELAV